MKITGKNFIYALGRIRHQAHGFLEREMEREGIRNIAPSCGDVFIIVSVKGPLSMKDIARHTYKDKSTITGAVKSLEAAGYLKRVRDPDDGRATLISATDRARKTMAAFEAISARMNGRLFEGIPEKEMNTLIRLLEKISGNMKNRPHESGEDSV